MKVKILLVSVLLAGLFNHAALADVTSAKMILDQYAALAKKSDPSYAGPSAADGRTFFNRKITQFKGSRSQKGKEVACASCHTANPADYGKHIVTGKRIKPLSPVVNQKRFTDFKHVEKQFTKHCKDVVGSGCTLQEKANYIAFLIEEKTPSKNK